MTVLSHRPSHDCGGNQLGEGADDNHHEDQPKRFRVANDDAEVNNHAHTNKEVRNEKGIAHKLEARHQGAGLGDEAVDNQSGKECAE